MGTLPTNVTAGTTGHVTHTNTLHTAYNGGSLVVLGKDGPLLATATALGGKLPLPFACELVDVRLALGTASSSGAVTIDVFKNGSTMFSTKPTLAAAATSSGSGNVPSSGNPLAAGDYLTVDLTAFGTSADSLTVVLRVRAL